MEERDLEERNCRRYRGRAVERGIEEHSDVHRIEFHREEDLQGKVKVKYKESSILRQVE